MKRRRFPLALCGLLLAGGLMGCGGDDSGNVIYESQPTAENDGQPARLTVAAYDWDESYREALEEVVERYRADFPETQVELREYPDKAALEEAARTGEADILQVQGEDVPGYAGSGLLADMMDYKSFWDYEGSLTESARRAMHSMGLQRLYAIPADVTQYLFFYRKDWIESYNEDQTANVDKAHCERWSQVLDASRKLGEKGGLAMSRGEMGALFDSVVWSGVGAGVPADLCAAYFGKGDPRDTIFSGEKAPEVMELFANIQAVLAEGGFASQKEAVDAFAAGESAFLFADASAAGDLAASMPPDSWSSVGMPQGEGGEAVAPFDWWGWGLSSQSAQREKALHFLCYMTNCDNNTHLAKVCGYLPIYREAVAMEPSLEEGGRSLEVRMLKDAATYRYASRPAMYEGCQEYGGWLAQRLEELEKGSLSPEELAARLDSYWLEAYSAQGQLWVDVEEEA